MNENLRRVTVQTCPTYQSDNGVAKYLFKIKKDYCGEDLSKLTAYLKIRFQDESTDKILISDSLVNGETLTLTFTVSDAVTRVAGEAKCQLCFENADGSVTVNTEIFPVEILDSIEVESYGQTILPSAIRLLQTQLSEKIDEMNKRIDSVNKAVIIKPVFVAAANFVNGEQLLALTGAKEDSVITFSPKTNALAVKNAGIYISGQDTDTVSIKYVTAPSSDFTLYFFVANKIEEESQAQTAQTEASE